MKGLQTFVIAVSMFFAMRPLVAQAASEASPQAQTNVMPLTLNDVLRLMLENNLNVAVDRLPPDVAQSMIGTYFQPFQPTLRISANGTRGTTPSPSLLSGATLLFQLTHSYDIAIGQTLRTGTSYGVDISLNRLTTNNIFALYNPSWFGQARYGITQHLLQNRGSSANGHSIRIAQNNHRISESQFEQQMMDLVAVAQNTYWDYVFSIEDIKVKQDSVQLAEKTLDENRQKVANGVLAPLDLVQAESQVAMMQDNLVVSTYSSRQDEDQLKKTISSQTDPGLIVAKLTPLDALRRPSAEDVVPVAQALQIALENRPEMRQVRLLLNNAEIDTTYTKNQKLPVLDINAAYTQTGLAGAPNLPSAVQGLIGVPITGLAAGKMSDALRQVFSADYNTYSFGFNLQIPLSNKAASSDYDRALSAKRLAQTRIDATAQQIALEVRTALNQVEMNQAHVETAGKSRDLAQQTLDAEQKKYESGVSTLFFVLQDQTNLAIAQTNEVQALANYNKSLAALDRATGQTLSRNRIEIEKGTPRTATATRR